MEHSSVKAFLSVLVLILGTAVPTASQNAAGYFSLGTQSTVRAGQNPKVQVYTSGVRSLEFRVYKVKDPVEFFRGLEDLHNFGGRAEELPRDLTPIERFHRFKTRLRARIISVFRNQYHPDSGRRRRQRGDIPDRAALEPATGRECVA